MEFIQQRSLLFKKIVLNHFIINYQLSITKFVNNLNIHNKNLIYVKGNEKMDEEFSIERLMFKLRK